MSRNTPYVIVGLVVAAMWIYTGVTAAAIEVTPSTPGPYDAVGPQEADHYADMFNRNLHSAVQLRKLSCIRPAVEGSGVACEYVDPIDSYVVLELTTDPHNTVVRTAAVLTAVTEDDFNQSASETMDALSALFFLTNPRRDGVALANKMVSELARPAQLLGKPLCPETIVVWDIGDVEYRLSYAVGPILKATSKSGYLRFIDHWDTTSAPPQRQNTKRPQPPFVDRSTKPVCG
jgi:hypothetical protein